MLNKKDYFYLDDTPIMPGKFVLRINHEKLKCTGTKGSYGVLPARFLGISYANYLRLCRDVCGAELVGKNSLYVVPYFTLNKETEAFIKLLNSLAKFAKLWQDDPDWQKKKIYMDEFYYRLGKRMAPGIEEEVKEKIEERQE